MKAKLEVFEDPAAFRRAVAGNRRATRARQTRPDVPRAGRAASGEGDRVPDLMTLASRGWTCTHYLHATGAHWMSGAAGTSARFPTYRALLDALLKGEADAL